MNVIRLKLTQQHYIRDCCARTFTETWLHLNILDLAIALDQRILSSQLTEHKTVKKTKDVDVDVVWTRCLIQS